MDYVKRVDRHPSLSLLCLAAALRQGGHDPNILDLNMLQPDEGVDPDSFYIQAVLDQAHDSQAGWVGINCLLSEHFPFVRKLATALKEDQQDRAIAIGGIHPTLFAEDIVRNCPDIDAVVLGEGESQAVGLSEAWQSGPSKNLNHIAGITFVDHKNDTISTPRKKFLKDLDQLATPAWDLFNLPDYFTDHSTWYNPRGLDIKMSVPILTSRSCPYDCSFCSIHPLMGKGLRLRSPSLVVDEMEMLYDKFDLNYFGFIDDNLTLNKKHIIGICNEIVQRDMKIQFESINGYIISSIDEEIAAAMVEAGCVYVIMPIEHGNDHMRNEIIGKRLDREKIFEVTDIYKSHNLLTRAYFIMGFPEETTQTMNDTLNMIQELKLDMNNVFNLIPFPGTRLFNQAVKDNLFVNDVDLNRLWEGNLGLHADNPNQLYLKPYNMELSELNEFHEKFQEFRIYSQRAKDLQQGKQQAN